MLNWILTKWSWKSFAIGAGAAVFGGTLARPVLVGAVKTGLEVRDRANETLETAKMAAKQITAEAMAMRSAEQAQPMSALLDEVRKLREEISSLKAGFGYTSPKA